MPELLAHCYNAISVGVPSGQSPVPATTLKRRAGSTGIVAPLGLLRGEFFRGGGLPARWRCCRKLPTLPCASSVRGPIRSHQALLLAGASKTQFPSGRAPRPSHLDLGCRRGQHPKQLPSAWGRREFARVVPSRSAIVAGFQDDHHARLGIFRCARQLVPDQLFSTVTWNRTADRHRPGPSFVMQTAVADLPTCAFTPPISRFGPLRTAA